MLNFALNPATFAVVSSAKRRSVCSGSSAEDYDTGESHDEEQEYNMGYLLCNAELMEDEDEGEESEGLGKAKEEERLPKSDSASEHVEVDEDDLTLREAVTEKGSAGAQIRTRKRMPCESVRFRTRSLRPSRAVPHVHRACRRGGSLSARGERAQCDLPGRPHAA